MTVGLASGCVLPWNPEPAQRVLSRAGHLGHVWEESRALCGVLESCARDVAQVLWLQHDHYSSSQCTYRTTQHLPPHCLHLTQGQSGAFWGQTHWNKLVGFSLLFTQGSSPAGGCLLSMTCDYRIMADNPRYSIGLNETKLGIVAPFW